jgi:hypothetical protein
MGENAAILNLGDKVILFLTNEAKLFVQAVDGKTYSPIADYAVASSRPGRIHLFWAGAF